MTMTMKISDRVQRSAYALRSKRDYWLSLGDYTRKQRAKEALDREIALRGTVVELLPEDFSRGVAAGVRIAWDDGTESRCLPGMVELADD